MSGLALVLPHREPSGAECWASDSAVPWPPRTDRCRECGAAGALRPLLSGREAAKAAGVTYTTWRDFGVDRKRPSPDFVGADRHQFWLPETIECWNLRRPMQKETIRRILRCMD